MSACASACGCGCVRVCVPVVCVCVFLLCVCVCVHVRDMCVCVCVQGMIRRHVSKVPQISRAALCSFSSCASQAALAQALRSVAKTTCHSRLGTFHGPTQNEVSPKGADHAQIGGGVVPYL